MKTTTVTSPLPRPVPAGTELGPTSGPLHVRFPLHGSLRPQLFARLTPPCVSGLTSDVTSSERPFLAAYLKEQPFGLR